MLAGSAEVKKTVCRLGWTSCRKKLRVVESSPPDRSALTSCPSGTASVTAVLMPSRRMGVSTSMPESGAGGLHQETVCGAESRPQRNQLPGGTSWIPSQTMPLENG